MEQEKNHSYEANKVPDKVLAVLYDAAVEEDRLRNLGVHPDRIARLAHIPMYKALTRLAIQKVNIDTAFPPETIETAVEADIEVPDEIFAAAERLMETTGWSYDDAIREAKRRAK